MMGLDNPLHIAFLLIVVLMVFGAKRLPEMGKSLGHGLRGFKDAINPEISSPALPAPPTEQAAHPAPAQPAQAQHVPAEHPAQERAAA